MSWIVEPPAVASLAVQGRSERFAIRRIWCVGRNYAAHVKEMGGDPQRDPPFFFAKPADAMIAVAANGVARVPYPSATVDFHHEVELVVALGRGGRDLSPEEALACVWGYGVGLDLTRRDLQAVAKKAGHPWEMSKGFDQSAVCGPLVSVDGLGGHLRSGSIALHLNGELRQQGDLAEQIWQVGETLSHLSRLVALGPGDLIYTGTPEGVGPMRPGDRFEAQIAGLPRLRGEVVARGEG